MSFPLRSGGGLDAARGRQVRARGARARVRGDRRPPSISIEGMALPPGPRIPPALQTLNWVVRPEAFMRACRRRYGDVFTVRLAQVGTLVFSCDPAEHKRVFTADPDALRAGEANASLEPVLGERSVLLLDGREHLRQRRLMLPPFHGERLARYEELMREITDRVVDSWEVGRPLKLQDEMQAITLEVILRVVFGMAEGERLEELRRLLKHLLRVATRPIALVPWLRREDVPGPFRAAMRAKAAVDREIYRLIDDRRADPGLDEREDILSMLMLARDEDGEPMTDVELRDELMTLLLAGHETTATALAWAFERMFRTPGVLERLAAEAAAGEETRYADATARDVLRLRPPIPLVARHVRAPFELAGYELPPGVIVAPCIYLTHRREEIYPDPEELRPERFLDVQPDTYAWIPFGGGIRRCLGASFALFEMRVVLQAILSRVRLAPERPADEGTRRRAIVLAPRRGAGAVVAERRERPREPARGAAAVV